MKIHVVKESVLETISSSLEGEENLSAVVRRLTDKGEEWPKYILMLISLLLFFTSRPSVATDAQTRSGTIHFSNGECIEGRLSLSPGTQFILHGQTQMWTLGLDQVREIRFCPEKEEMVRAWRFLEAGQTTKEFSGAPYPIRHLRATLLTGNETLTGHLCTTVLYVETPEKTQKVILSAKQRGKEGETLDSLAYPASIIFTDQRSQPEGAIYGAQSAIHVRITIAGAEGSDMELSALTQPALVRLTGRKGSQPNEYLLPPPMGSKVFLALKSGPTLHGAQSAIHVGWPANTDDALTSRVKDALAIARDFFDDRTLLGVFHDASNQDLYALLLLWRKGKTTLEGERTQPWRVSVWRWKVDSADGRLMLAGRGDFFRGIIAPKGEPLPTVVVSDSLWNLRQEGNGWTVNIR